MCLKVIIILKKLSRFNRKKKKVLIIFSSRFCLVEPKI